MDATNQPFRRKRFAFFPFILVGFFVFSGIVMWLWNTILPDLVHVGEITYWKAMGLLALCRILFGGFKFGGAGNHAGFPRGQWKEKWMNMSDEDRAKFKEQWREKCRRRS
jgi:Ca2+/H+ antiporter, TMEM165/GDT1 family